MALILKKAALCTEQSSSNVFYVVLLVLHAQNHSCSFISFVPFWLLLELLSQFLFLQEISSIVFYT